MPRRLFLKLRPIAAKMRESWYFRMLGPRLTDSRLWSMNRRGITTAFGAAIAILFIPLPTHVLFGLLAAMIWRLNLPTMIVSLFLLNPLTAVPLYYAAYRVGTLVLGQPVGNFAFELSWTWLQTGLGSIWKPFLVGCLVCSIVGGFLAYWLLELIWRISTVNRLNAKRAGVREN
ncbi:MAG: DUF2062 domain-containing protein [Steroidobacteraceae bacterium]